MSQPLIDAAGGKHTRASGHPRIVCLVPSITELLCDLGLAPAIVGRTGFCIHPRELVRRIPKLGGTKNVDLDKLRSLAPTHAIVNVDENSKQDAQALAACVPSVVVTHPLAPLDNLALYRLIGGVFGREREAEALCARFEAEYAAVQSAARAFQLQRVLYLIWKKPWMTVSRDTYVSRMLALVRWETVPQTAADRYPSISLEDETVGRAPVVLLSSEPYVFRDTHAEELRRRFPDRTVALIDGEMIAWYGSRAIKALGYLARFRAELDCGQARA